MGSFISADTVVPEVGHPRGWNRYGYVYGNPVRYSDPSGHCPPSVCRDEQGRPIDAYYRYGDRAVMDALPLSGLNPWYPVDVVPPSVIDERPEIPVSDIALRLDASGMVIGGGDVNVDTVWLWESNEGAVLIFFAGQGGPTAQGGVSTGPVFYIDAHDINSLKGLSDFGGAPFWIGENEIARGHNPGRSGFTHAHAQPDELFE